MTISTINFDATCENLKELCAKKGYSASRLQRELGLGSTQAVYKWFCHKNLPTVDNLVGIASLLEVTIDDICVTEDIEIGA